MAASVAPGVVGKQGKCDALVNPDRSEGKEKWPGKHPAISITPLMGGSRSVGGRTYSASFSLTATPPRLPSGMNPFPVTTSFCRLMR
jgi:hypothetical protein